MTPNLMIAFIAALVPLIVGFVWYNPKVFGTAWIKSTGLSEEELRKASMPRIFLFTYIFGLLISLAVFPMVIHQFAFSSILLNEPGMQDPNSEIRKYIADFMNRYGSNFRTFKHGAFHGTIAGIFVAMPILGINALFERKGAKYIFIHTGYWIVTLALMGGIICQFG